MSTLLPQTQSTENDDDNLIDYLKASVRNVLASTFVCLLCGAVYYFVEPNLYAATVTVQVSKVAGELIETPDVLLEKIKIPTYFTGQALRVCGLGEVDGSKSNFADKLKPAISKSTLFITFTAQARTSQEAQACLEVVTEEIRKSQAWIAQPLIDRVKQSHDQLVAQLEIAQEKMKQIQLINSAFTTTPSDIHLLGRILAFSQATIIRSELIELKREITSIENKLLPPQTSSMAIVAPIYASEVPINKRPLLVLACIFALWCVYGANNYWSNACFASKSSVT
jgi:hypothetical protein